MDNKKRVEHVTHVDIQKPVFQNSQQHQSEKKLELNPT